ncbi:MAG TPA: hypothetical protein VFR34_06255, partial [Paracoccaceae bacterium]|nr:hypothetical protein [Paracoccaceae bacterium]
MSAGETSSVAALLQIGFMLGCLVLVVLVHSVRRFDLRSLAPGGGQGGAAAEETGRSRAGRMGDM